MNNKFESPIKKENLKIILIGLAINIVGYLLMIGGGSEDPNVFSKEELFSTVRITVSPILIVLGFGIMIYGIMKRNRNTNEEK
jgi:membrane-bound ClpP family serine protease